MRLVISLLLFLSTLTSASPASSGIEGIAELTDTPPTGYATLGGGTSGGKGGSTIHVSSVSALQSAVSGVDKKIVIIDGMISGDAKIKVGSNKSIIGRNSGSGLHHSGLLLKGSKNVIIRNLKISKVKASEGDAITVQESHNVWIDHCDLSSDLNNGKDYYDGLIDIVHGSDFVTVSNTRFHDHFKASLVGHSDKNGDQDRSHLRVTYYNNVWTNINSRAPSLRFGTGHIFNSMFNDMSTAINVRQGAQVLVQGNIFRNVSKTLYSVDTGFGVESGNDFGSARPEIQKGKLQEVPYKYTVIPVAKLKESMAKVGNSLSFGS